MNDDTLLKPHKAAIPMNRKNIPSHNAHHTPCKRIRLNEAKFSDYCSTSLRHAVETPFQAYADECETTPNHYHLSCQTVTSSIMPQCSKLNNKLSPSDNGLPFLDPGSPPLAYRENSCIKNMADIKPSSPIGQYLSLTKVSSVIRNSLFAAVDATIVSHAERCVSTKCIDKSPSLVDTVTDDVIPSPSCYQDSHISTKGSPGGANRPKAAQPCLNPSKLLNDNNAVIELKPLFPSLHPPGAVTTCSARILTCRTSTAVHFFPGSVEDITLPQPSDSKQDELGAKPSSLHPLQPYSATDATSEPKSKTISKPTSVAPLVPVHGSALYSSMPNTCERFPRPICTGDTLTGRHMECENAPSSLDRLMSMDDENIKHKTLVNFNSKAASASVKQTNSIKYRRQAYSEKLKLRCSN